MSKNKQILKGRMDERNVIVTDSSDEEEDEKEEAIYADSLDVNWKNVTNVGNASCLPCMVIHIPQDKVWEILSSKGNQNYDEWN